MLQILWFNLWCRWREWTTHEHLPEQLRRVWKVTV